MILINFTPLPQPAPPKITPAASCRSLCFSLLMEIQVEVLDVQLYEGTVPLGRYNIHCRVETCDTSFTNSSVFIVEESDTPNGRRIAQPGSSSTSIDNWLKFSYEFQRRHKEPVVHLQLSDLSDVDNQIVIAQGLIPLRLSGASPAGNRKETINRTAYLASKVDELPLVQQVGRINIQVIINYRSHSSEEESEQLSATEENGMPGWTQTESAHSNLLFLNTSVEDTNQRQSVGGESIISDHIELLDANTASFTHNHPVITVIFHFYATEDVTASYHTISFLNLSHKAKELVQNTPFAMWNLDPTHDRKFQYANILSQRNHLLTSISDVNAPKLLGLIIMKDSRQKPLFSAFENVIDMSPFMYIHRAWLTDTFKPTPPSDPLREATKHIVTSIHYTPPISSYTEYNGLEVAIMRFHLEQQKDYVITMEAIHQDSYTSRTKPPFLDTNTESLSEYKLAYVQLQDDHSSQQSPSVYFFYKSQAIFDSYRPVSNHSTLLVLQIYTVDHSFVQPWWTGDITCSTVRSIDQHIYTILKDDIACNGLRWRIDWEDLNWSIDVVLRLKTTKMGFLQPMTNEELYKLPVLDNPEHTQSLSSTVTPINDRQSIPTIRVMNEEVEDEGEVENKETHQESANIMGDVIQYLDIITKLTDQIEKLQKDNACLQQENGYLQGQLAVQQPNAAIAVHWSLDQVTQSELQMLTKAELISKVLSFQEALEIETGHKERYQQKVFEVQNELLGMRSKEREYLKLQEAHKLQQKLVQDLQRKVKKYRQCYQTTLQQEKVIKQLEGLLFEQREEETIAKVTSKKNPPTATPSLPTIHEDNVPIMNNRNEVLDDQQQEDFDSSNIEERLYRLEALTNQSHINQINFAAMLKESAARERHLRQSLMATKASMDSLKTENRELKRNVLSLLNIRPQPPPTTATVGPSTGTRQNTSTPA